MKRLIMTDGSKAININQLPAQAWESLGAGAMSSAKALKLYEAVPYLYRAVNLRASAVSKLPYEVLFNDKPADPDRYPWIDSLPAVFEQVEADRVIFGAAYQIKESNAFNIVTGFRRLLPSTVSPVFDKESGLVNFKRRIDNRTIRLETSDLFYSWITPRGHELGAGESPLMAAANAANLLKQIDVFGAGYFERGAIMPILVSLDQAMPQSEVDRVESWFRRMATGVQSAFKAIGLSGSIEVKEIGHALKDLSMADLSQSKREDIAAALGIPVTLLMSGSASGLGGGGVRRQDTLDFYDYTVIPSAEAIAVGFNEQVLAGSGLKLRFRPDLLEIYQDMESQKADKLAALFDRGIISREEFRDQMGLAPSEPVNMEPAPASLDIAEDDPDPLAGLAGTMADSVQGEIRRWRRMAAKRFKENKPEKAADFESDLIPAALRSAIVTALKTAADVDEARGVFDDALAWRSYP